MTAEEYRALLDVDFNNVKIEDLTDIRKIKIDMELSTKGEYNNLYMYDDYIVEEIFPLNTNSAYDCICSCGHAASCLR